MTTEITSCHDIGLGRNHRYDGGATCVRCGGTRRVARADALPEAYPYRDDGCEVSPSCQACPLPQCRYDVPGGARAMRSRERDAAIRAAREQGMSVDEAVKRFGVSRRQVFRASSTGAKRVTMTAKNKDTSGETRRAVAAALEAMRPSALSQKRPSVPARCPRCGGSIIAATEAGGERDDHCLSCSFRPAALTPEQARAEVERFEAPGKSRRRMPTSGGVKL